MDGDDGTVFHVEFKWAQTALNSSSSVLKTHVPTGWQLLPLMQATNGDLYGTTGQGGANPAPDGFDGGNGVRLSLGLGQLRKFRLPFASRENWVEIPWD